MEEFTLPSIEARVSRVFQLVLGTEEDVMTVTRSNTPAWDSVFQITLALSLEEEFAVSFSDDQIVDLDSYQVAVGIIETLVT